MPRTGSRTYFAVEGDESEALHWLAARIYLGMKKLSLVPKNPCMEPACTATRTSTRILEDLRKTHRRNSRPGGECWSRFRGCSR